MNQINLATKVILKSLINISVQHKPNSITIKLPSDVNDFGSLAKVSEDLQLILNQTIVNSHIKGETTIQSVENGSIWIEVCLATPAALTLVAGLTWSAMVIYKKMQEGKMFHQHVESLKIKNESLQEIQKAQKELLDLLTLAEATNLKDSYFGPDDHEQIGRISLSIKMLSGLIDRGAEIHPALNTPENVANLFPDKNNLGLVQSKIKQLSENNT